MARRTEELRTGLRDDIALTAAMCIEALSAPVAVSGSATTGESDAPSTAPVSDPQQGLAAAHQLVASAERALHLLVGDARAQGMSWAAIGETLGITRQAAQKRFSGSPPQKVMSDLREPSAELIRLAVDLMDDAVGGRFERLTALSSSVMLAGLEGDLAQAFAPVNDLFGSLLRRSAPSARLISGMTIVRAIEERAIRPALVEVTFTADGQVHGFRYHLPSQQDAAAAEWADGAAPGPR